MSIRMYFLKANYKRRFYGFLFSYEAVSTPLLEHFWHKSVHVLPVLMRAEG